MKLEAGAVRHEEKCQPAKMKAANDGRTRRKTARERPFRRLKATRLNDTDFAKVAYLLIGEHSLRNPRKNIDARHDFDRPRRGINPRPDRHASEAARMSAAAESPPEIADERPHIKPTSDGEAKRALMRQIMLQPLRIVQIDVCRRESHNLTAMRPFIGAFAINALGAGGRRNLFGPAEESLKRLTKLELGQS